MPNAAAVLPRAVSLDLWGTLLRSDPAFKPLRNDFLRTTFASHVPHDEFDQALRQADRDADQHSIDTGVDLALMERVTLCLTNLGISDLPSAADPVWASVEREQARLAREHHPVALDPHLPQALADLARLVPLAATSNTGMLPGSLMRDLLKRAGIGDVFSAYVFSNEERVPKPDSAIFETARARLATSVPGPALAMAEVVHLGDNPQADVRGALDAGMQAVLVNVGEGAIPITVALRGLTARIGAVAA